MSRLSTIFELFTDFIILKTVVSRVKFLLDVVRVIAASVLTPTHPILIPTHSNEINHFGSLKRTVFEFCN